MTTRSRLERGARRGWAIARIAASRFSSLDGTRWASAFAYHAFFSLFPLMVLLVAIASRFIDPDRAATEIIAWVESHVPLSGDMQSYVFETVAGVIRARGQAGAIAFCILVWAALQGFSTLVSATNLAWGGEPYDWWRLPLKSLVLLGVTAAVVLLSIWVPILAQMAKDWIAPVSDFHPGVYAAGGLFIPLLVLFAGLGLFYRLAPRRRTRFSEVWIGALCTTLLLLAAESLFVIYLENFAGLNAIYGTFGGIMALLLWIYLSGGILVFGACLCAAQAEERAALAG